MGGKGYLHLCCSLILNDITMLQQYRDYLRTRNRTRKPLKQKEAGFLPTIKVRMSKNDVNVYKQETSLYS